MPGEREIDALLEQHWTSECLIGDVEEIAHFRRSGPGFAIAILRERNEDGLQRVIIAKDEGVQMFPDYLVGKCIRVICRRHSSNEWTAHYSFSALAHVEGLSMPEEERLWPWRAAAKKLLLDPYIPMNQFEEGLCHSLSVRGRPPTEKQRAFFNRISQRRDRRSHPPSRDSMLRARRHRPRQASDARPIGEALLELLAELKEIWRQSQV